MTTMCLSVVSSSIGASLVSARGGLRVPRGGAAAGRRVVTLPAMPREALHRAVAP